MAAPQFLRANAPDLFGSTMLPVLEEIFWSKYSTHPMRRDTLFKKVSTDTSIYQYTEMHDMPQFLAVSEGQDYTFKAPKQGYDATATINKFGLGFSISQEAIDDGKHEFVSDAVAKMAKSAGETQEIAAMNIFNNGFSSVTTADGQVLFYNAHTTPSGTYTVSNVLSTAADLSESSLEAAVSQFEKTFVGDSGIINSIRPKYLVVPSEMRLTAKRLVGSELLPGSPNNDINPLKDEGLTVISSPHLTDADGWFLTASPEDTGLRLIIRKPVETMAAGGDAGYLNDSMLYKARYREAIAAFHPNGVLGTPGV